jgi:hypothetical protein
LNDGEIEKLIGAVNGSALRIKGYLRGRDGDYLVSVSDDQREITRLPPAVDGTERRYGITVIVPGSPEIQEKTKERYRKALPEL